MQKHLVIRTNFCIANTIIAIVLLQWRPHRNFAYCKINTIAAFKRIKRCRSDSRRNRSSRIKYCINKENWKEAQLLLKAFFDL